MTQADLLDSIARAREAADIDVLEAIGDAKAEGKSDEEYFLSLVTSWAEEIRGSARAYGLGLVDVIRNLRLRERLIRGRMHARPGRGGYGVSRIEEYGDGLLLVLQSGGTVEYSPNAGWGNTYKLNGSKIGRLELEEQLGWWPGFLDGISLSAANLRHLRRQLETEARQELVKTSEDLQRETRAERHRLLRQWRRSGPDVQGWTLKAEKPEKLKHICGIQQFDPRRPCHVYFLLLRGEVVYVGRSGGAWPARIESHIRENEKEFDDVWYLPVDANDADIIERLYIKKFLPRYNRSMMPKMVEEKP